MSLGSPPSVIAAGTVWINTNDVAGPHGRRMTPSRPRRRGGSWRQGALEQDSRLSSSFFCYCLSGCRGNKRCWSPARTDASGNARPVA